MIQNGAKMGSGPHLGRRWVQGGKKGAQSHSFQHISGVIFMTFGYLFPCLFLMLFWKASFSPLGRLLGAQGAQKGAKMEPKASLGVPSGKCKKHGRGYVFST